jgi:hypothetical protein
VGIGRRGVGQWIGGGGHGSQDRSMQVCKFYKPRMCYLLRFQLLFCSGRTQRPSS